MSMYDDTKVSLSLGDLSAILCAANCLEFTNEKLEAREKRIADLMVESERQTKEIDQQRVSIMEAERELAAWKQAENADTSRAAAFAYLEEHNTPFEGNDVDTACEVIRALLVAKPREVSPLFRQRIENAKDVLRQITPVVADCDGSFGKVEGDRFNTVYNTLQELYDVTRVEVL